MDKAWIEAFAKYGPWAILVFVLLFGLYKTVVPAVIRLIESLISSNQEHLKAIIERSEQARKEERERYLESLRMMAQRALEHDQQYALIHREMMAAIAEQRQATASELRALGDRLPNTRRGG